MKTVTTGTKSKKLPPNHIAVLFEGSWFFTKDPNDSTRILAMCPYTNAPDHICEFGQWKTGKPGTFVGPTGTGSPLLMNEGDMYQVDVDTDLPSNKDFAAVFEKAWHTYHFVYLKSSRPGIKLDIDNMDNTQMRRISIAMPDSVRMDARVTSATVKSGSDYSENEIMCGLSENAVIHSYVTFLFIYTFEDGASLKLQANSNNTVVSTDKIKNPHLIFRVRSPEQLDEYNCEIDCSEDNSHLMNTFNTLRKFATLPPASAGDGGSYCDIAVYPKAGKPINFHVDDTELSPQELGLGDRISRANVAVGPYLGVKTLASCASGPVVGNPDPPPGPMLKRRKK